MVECKKLYKVEYAHQLYKSYSALCHETIHGHSGKIELTLRRQDCDVDDTGMVVDFGQVSDVLKKHIMNKYDHALFMPCLFDKAYLDTLAKYNKRLRITEENPTAENFAKWILGECNILLYTSGIPARVVSVRFWETETGSAVASVETVE